MPSSNPQPYAATYNATQTGQTPHAAYYPPTGMTYQQAYPAYPAYPAAYRMMMVQQPQIAPQIAPQPPATHYPPPSGNCQVQQPKPTVPTLPYNTHPAQPMPQMAHQMANQMAQPAAPMAAPPMAPPMAPPVPQSMPPPSPQNTSAPPKAVIDTDAMKDRLARLINDKDLYVKSMKSSFRQFDKDHSGSLDFAEVRSLIDRLCLNVQLPPVDDATLKKFLEKHDRDGSGQLELAEFAEMYWRLLKHVQEKYYPPQQVMVDRISFIKRIRLDRSRTIQDIFTFVKLLGNGSFGEVHKVIDRTNNLERACKTINKDRCRKTVSLEQIDREIDALKKLDHPNVIKIFQVYEDYTSVYIVQELCNGGMLYDRVVTAHDNQNNLTEHYVALIMQQILEAFVYIHAKNIVHKDLKPENIMFLSRDAFAEVKIVDFGLAELFAPNQEYLTAAAGTALYMAPEVYKRHFGKKCDVWSAGCIMYQLLTGKLPFDGRTSQEVRRKVEIGNPNYQQTCSYLSQQAIDLMRLMIQVDPDKRLSARQCLDHPWFQLSRTNQISISPEICRNLKKYMNHTGLKNALINMMAHNLNLSSDQIKQISDIFRELDKDKNGTLSESELEIGLRNAGIPGWNIVKILQAMKVDGNSEISYTEFLAACYSWRESELNIVWTSFNQLDKDGDGKITIDELSNLLSSNKMMSNPEEVKKIIKSIDRNNDGMIDWFEFIDYLRNQ